MYIYIVHALALLAISATPLKKKFLGSWKKMNLGAGQPSIFTHFGRPFVMQWAINNSSVDHTVNLHDDFSSLLPSINFLLGHKINRTLGQERGTVFSGIKFINKTFTAESIAAKKSFETLRM